MKLDSSSADATEVTTITVFFLPATVAAVVVFAVVISALPLLSVVVISATARGVVTPVVGVVGVGRGVRSRNVGRRRNVGMEIQTIVQKPVQSFVRFFLLRR